MNAKRNVILAGMMFGVIVGFASAATPSDAIEFKFAHELGKVFRQKLTTKTVGTMKMAEPMPEQKFSQMFEYEIQTTCKKINSDGTAVYEMTIPLMAMTMDVGGLKSVYRVAAKDGKVLSDRSENPKDIKQKTDNLFKLWTAIVEGKFTLILDAKGKAIKLEGFADAMKKAKKECGPLSAMDQMVIDQLSEAFSDETMIKQINSNDTLFPNRPVRTGDTWSREVEMKIPFLNVRMLSKSEYKLIGIEPFRGRTCAKIAIKTSTETIPNTASESATTQPSQGQNLFANMKMDMKMSDGSGIAYVDYEKSKVLKMQQSSRMTIEITTKFDGGDSAKGSAAQAHMVQKLLNSVTVELVEPASAMSNK